MSNQVWRWLRLAWVVAAWLVLGAAAHARPNLTLETSLWPVPLADHGAYWIDPQGRATPDTLATRPDLPWRPTAEDRIYPLHAGQSLWVRFTVPPTTSAERWYLEIPLPSVDRVTLFALDSAGGWQTQTAGDTLAVRSWTLPHRHPLLPMITTPGASHTYLLRIESTQGFSAPLRFISDSALARNEQRVALMLGMYLGLAALAITISAISAVSLRDAAFALYIPTVALLALTQLALTGLAGLHLWPNAPQWNDASGLVLPMLALVCLLLFISAAVYLPQRSPSRYRILVGLTTAGIMLALTTTFASGAERLLFALPFMALAQAYLVYLLLWSWLRGDPQAGWLLAGGLPMVVFGLFPTLRGAGLIPQGLLTQYGLQIGAFIELPMMLVALMLRSSQRRESRQRMRGLSRVDAATGLINEELFAERLNHMLARSRRLGHQSCVMLIDLANLDALQRDFGRKATRDMPLRVATRLLSSVRDIDSVARLSELRFGLLLEGPQPSDGAAGVGARLVARCLMPIKGLPAECVPQLRVAQALVPQDAGNAEEVLARLSRVLELAPADSRRAIFTLRSTQPQT